MDEFEGLLYELRAARDDVVEAQRQDLPDTDILDRRHRAYKAWQAAEGYRRKTGCSTAQFPNPGFEKGLQQCATRSFWNRKQTAVTWFLLRLFRAA